MACSHPRSAVPIDLATAIAWSCNEYFAVAAGRLRTTRLCDTLRRCGFEVQVPGAPEQQSLMGIGEWGVRCTVVQLAEAYRKLAQSCPALIGEGLEGAVKFGTARLARPAGMAIRGKTGTTGRHALFAGWSARVAVAVVAAGGYGGADAAPVARGLFGKYT